LRSKERKAAVTVRLQHVGIFDSYVSEAQRSEVCSVAAYRAPSCAELRA